MFRRVYLRRERRIYRGLYGDDLPKSDNRRSNALKGAGKAPRVEIERGEDDQTSKDSDGKRPLRAEGKR